MFSYFSFLTGLTQPTSSLSQGEGEEVDKAVKTLAIAPGEKPAYRQELPPHDAPMRKMMREAGKRL